MPIKRNTQNGNRIKAKQCRQGAEETQALQVIDLRRSSGRMSFQGRHCPQLRRNVIVSAQIFDQNEVGLDKNVQRYGASLVHACPAGWKPTLQAFSARVGKGLCCIWSQLSPPNGPEYKCTRDVRFLVRVLRLAPTIYTIHKKLLPNRTLARCIASLQSPLPKAWRCRYGCSAPRAMAVHSVKPKDIFRPFSLETTSSTRLTVAQPGP